ASASSSGRDSSAGAGTLVRPPCCCIVIGVGPCRNGCMARLPWAFLVRKTTRALAVLFRPMPHRRKKDGELQILRGAVGHCRLRLQALAGRGAARTPPDADGPGMEPRTADRLHSLRADPPRALVVSAGFHAVAALRGRNLGRRSTKTHCQLK